jgi:uncharacterized membrane protein
MKIRKSNFWTVLSCVIGYVGVGLGLILCTSGAWLKLSGYEIKIPTSFANGSVGGWKIVTWRHFLYAGALIAAVILVAVIFRLIGNAVYKKRVKRALEEARKANTGYGGLLAGYNMDAETQEKVVDTAKKAVPVVAGVVLACVVFKAVKKSQARKRMEEMRAARYYYY